MVPHRVAGYAWAVAATAACSALGFLVSPPLGLVNVAMVYLLGVVGVSLTQSRGGAVLASVLCVLAFDVLFVPPQGSLTVDDAEYLVTFAIMLGVALAISALAERLRREAQAAARLAAENDTERVRSVLLASISHDLRTPLAVLSGASSSLVDQWDHLSEAERRELAASVCRQSRQVAEHTEKVLQMTRLEAGRVELQRDWTDIPEVIATVLERGAERHAAHRIVVDLPPELPLVRADASLVEVALANLVENAARYTPAGTVVRVRARSTGDTLTLTVEDYGGGLPEAELERVFAKFHRLDMEGGSAGMGLGLAICRAVATLHGGRAWAEAVPAGGLAFHFTLPVEATPAPPPPGEGA